MCYFWALRTGHLEIVKYLVENYAAADINRVLYDASEYGHIDIVKYAVENGADIHRCNDRAIKIAAECNHVEVVKF